jgi:hypothetical protein
MRRAAFMAALIFARMFLLNFLQQSAVSIQPSGVLNAQG